LLSQGRMDAAEEALVRIISNAADLGLRTQIVVNSLSARIAARRGDHEKALGYARKAVELTEDVDDLRLSAEILFTLGTVQRDAGLIQEAAHSASVALDQYVAKGAALPAARVRAWLGSMIDPGGVTHD
jgi:tetratricopeptide (TPR) repeat protein